MYYQRRNFMSSVPQITRNLIILNVVVYLLTSFRGDSMYETFALFYPKSPFFHIWQPVTYMFMHGGFWHIFMNMYVLMIFGSALERVWGPKKFLLYYMITGLGAAAIHLGIMGLQVNFLTNAGNLAQVMTIYRTPTVGASGAIYGLLLGYCMLYPDAQLQFIFPPVAVKAWLAVIIFAAIELLSGVFGGGGVAHFAHLGGMIFGFALIMYWKARHTLYSYYE